jgi:chromosome segregation and condensation protein ScpB
VLDNSSSRRQRPTQALAGPAGVETVQLSGRELIATGPRSLRRGAPYTFVTTDQFLVAFDFESLRDLPDQEQLEDAGLTE